MQQLSLLETSLPQNEDHAVWKTLDEEQRALVVAVLARLIAKLTTARRVVTKSADKGRDHD
ncbi:MAG TPA: hypothetical protein VGX03_39285 [Candidatus Binatia bacterium]|nr:hypothetical protein [Candidatus Binatia bacterium]